MDNTKNAPSIYTIDVVLGCNLECPECACGGEFIKRKKKCMTFDEFKVIADKVAPYAEYIYLHCWGEPLLNRDIFSIIEYSSKICPTNISTNGMLVTEDVAKKLINSGVKDIIISIDGTTQETYEKYRKDSELKRSACFEYNRPIIKCVDEYKKELLECRDFKDVMNIDVEGNAVLCCYDANSEVIFGNLFKETVEEIICGTAYSDFLNGINNGVVPDFCLKNCLRFNQTPISVVLWGIGNYGKNAFSYLRYNPSYEICHICDSNKQKIGTDYKEFAVEDIKDIITQRDYEMLLLCADNWEGMYLFAKENGVSESKIFIWDSNNKIIKKEDDYLLQVHSQDGEELFLKEIFYKKGVYSGTYVDVGAYHPIKYSNTLWAYRDGWKGINIEPNIDSFKLFEKMRPEDINVNAGILNREGTMKYYKFDEGRLNTFDKERADYLSEELGLEVQEISEVDVIPLQTIFDRYRINHVDFLDIDVEGHEMEVIKSVDFEKVHIDYILVEQLAMNLYDVCSSEIAKYLKQQGYIAISKFDRTVIYEKT